MVNTEPQQGRQSGTQEIRERVGIQLDFGINDEFLISRTLTRSLNPSETPQLVNLQNTARRISPEFFNYIIQRYETRDAPLPLAVTAETFHQQYQEYINALINTPEYQVVRQETEEYLKQCREQWNHNLPKSQEIIRDLTGLDLNRRVGVLILHPDLGVGNHIPRTNAIAWGYREEWMNYTTVYLWHEIMHSYFGHTDVEHAIIQLLTDNELRVRLNGGTYGQPDLQEQRFEGHPQLFPLMDKILPEWNAYLASPTLRNIYDFRQRITAHSDNPISGLIQK